MVTEIHRACDACNAEVSYNMCNMCNESVSPLHPLWMANVLPQGCRGQLYATDTTVVFEASV